MVLTMRVTILLLILGGLAVAVAGMRVEQTRTMARIQQLRRRQGELREQIDTNQVRLARLRSPQRIEKRVGQLELPVMTPEETVNGSATEPTP